jgi:hypothetical protein
MDASTRPSTAFEQVSAAYERLKQRRLRAAASERRTRIILLALTMLTFGSLAIGAVVYGDRIMQSIEAISERQGSPGKGKSWGSWLPQSLRSSIANQRSEEESKFAETRTGQVRSFVGGNTCREMQFNNSAGRFSHESLTQCESDSKSDPSEIPQTKRLNAIRDAFSTR